MDMHIHTRIRTERGTEGIKERVALYNIGIIIRLSGTLTHKSCFLTEHVIVTSHLRQLFQQ